MADKAKAAADKKEPVAPVDAATAPVTDEVTSKLEEHNVEKDVIAKIKDELGVATVDDLAVLTVDDLTAAGMKPVPARKLVSALAPAKVVTDVAASAISATQIDDLLPTLPSDDAWLNSLRTGGVSKVDQSTVIAAVRATLAHRVGFYDVPGLLVNAMEEYADKNEEPVDTEYYTLRKQVTRRQYGDLFAAIDGFDGQYVTEARKKELFVRIDRYLWPAIIAFNTACKSWEEAWGGSANPLVLMTMVVAASSGIGAMPPGMMQPPDTGVLRDAADDVNDAINKCFAGSGIQIAAALAYDATKINETLSNPRLPALVGAANREQMLKQLGVAVPATYTRLETSLTRYVLATMQVQNQPVGSEELSYFGAILMLGSQIPWDQLGASGKVSGIGGRANL